jgi:hypothetical protein
MKATGQPVQLTAESRSARLDILVIRMDGPEGRVEHTLTSRAKDARGRIQPAPDDPFITMKKTYWEANQQAVPNAYASIEDKPEPSARGRCLQSKPRPRADAQGYLAAAGSVSAGWDSPDHQPRRNQDAFAFGVGAFRVSIAVDQQFGGPARQLPGCSGRWSRADTRSKSE